MRRYLVGTLSIVLVVALGACATPVFLGWTESPGDFRGRAESALDEARAAGARAWAPELLRRAETTLRLNLAEERRQSQRLLPLRDFRVARAGFARAQREALAAGREAARRADGARQLAADDLAAAESALQHATRVLDAAGRQVDLRGRLARARILFDEGRLRFGAGEYAISSERALLAEEHAHDVLRRATAMMERYVDASEVARWQRWIDETVRGSKRSGEPAIVVSKDDHRLTLYLAGRAVRDYPADIGLNNLSGKMRAGDHATPEGRYRITEKRGVGRTQFYKALMLDYPNQEDRRRFEEMRRRGEIPRGVGPGSLIEIHGEGGRDQDWTRGCVAVSNDHMDELFERVRVGTPVTIVGGRGEGGVFSTLVRNYAALERRGGDDTAVD